MYQVHRRGRKINFPSDGSPLAPPPYYPDKSPLDLYFRSQVMAHIVQCQPNTLAELKQMVEDFVANMSENEVGKMTSHTKKKS